MKYGLFPVLALAGVLAAPQARASNFFTSDAYNFAALYEGSGGKNFAFNNSNVTGDIGLGGTGVFQGNGPGTINGTIEFAAGNTPNPFHNSGLTITGNGGVPIYNSANVTADLTNINNVSQTLGGEAGTSLAFVNGGSINVNNCTVLTCTLDANGYYVFTLSSLSTTNGHTFTITGDGTHNVVFNVPSSINAQFNGDIILAGGITSDQVLFNLTAGDYSTLSGGNTLQLSTSCDAGVAGCSVSGIFLDVNGNFSINHSVLDGRIFGGGSSDSSIQSGANIYAPSPPVPEPTSVVLLATALLIAFVTFRKKLSRS